MSYVCPKAIPSKSSHLPVVAGNEQGAGQGLLNASPIHFPFFFDNRTLILFGRQFAQLNDYASKFSSTLDTWREGVYLNETVVWGLGATPPFNLLFR